jgi:anaerobic sulfite reductase subunit C
MRWTEAADQAISRAPFFVRKRIRKRVEEEAVRLGAGEVRLEHVEACRRRMLNQMEEEIRGYRVETCFGFNGCPNRAFADPELVEEIERQLAGKNLKSFLKERVGGPLKWHHEFRVSLSACPNACSQPQIVDIGLIGARRPRVGSAPCTGCGACVAMCREGAIVLAEDREWLPSIDRHRCLDCGQCLNVCPAGVLEEDAQGFRVLLGGKLGRHPQLGKELTGIFPPQDFLLILNESLSLYLQHNASGERFGEILHRTGIELLTASMNQQEISV